jgi:hypothetical protein
MSAKNGFKINPEMRFLTWKKLIESGEKSVKIRGGLKSKSSDFEIFKIF